MQTTYFSFDLLINRQLKLARKNWILFDVKRIELQYFCYKNLSLICTIYIKDGNNKYLKSKYRYMGLNIKQFTGYKFCMVTVICWHQYFPVLSLRDSFLNFYLVEIFLFLKRHKHNSSSSV